MTEVPRMPEIEDEHLQDVGRYLRKIVVMMQQHKRCVPNRCFKDSFGKHLSCPQETVCSTRTSGIARVLQLPGHQARRTLKYLRASTTSSGVWGDPPRKILKTSCSEIDSGGFWQLPTRYNDRA